MRSTAVAHPNIALVKYWGKRDVDLNLPATGSLSVTLGGLETRTTVEFVEGRGHDSLHLDGGAVGSGRELDRVESFLDLVRERADLERGARVETRNTFPTGAGLASSASGFAALAMAATRAAGLELSGPELSRLARRGSGSAARSIFGGFVEMHRGSESDGSDAYAEPIVPTDHWDLRCFVAETDTGSKRIGSTEGMLHTERTSPYHDAWVETVERDLQTARDAVEARDFDPLAEVAESNCLRMHADALAADSGLLYWNGATVSLIHRLRDARRNGLDLFFTIDAGPHVKVFCLPEAEPDVSQLLADADEVLDVHESSIGPGAHVVEGT